MPFPKALDERLRKQAAALFQDAFHVLRIAQQEPRTVRDVEAWETRIRTGRDSMITFEGVDDNSHGPMHFATARSAAMILINQLDSGSGVLASERERVKAMTFCEHDAQELCGIAVALEENLKSGMFEPIAAAFEAAIATDYLGQAESLMGDRPRGTALDWVPAAVMFRALLERGIKTLCSRQTPAILLHHPSGKVRGLEDLVNALKALGVYAEPRAKELRAWVAIGNDAAHGDWDKLTIDQASVERMRDGVKQFLTDFR